MIGNCNLKVLKECLYVRKRNCWSITIKKGERETDRQTDRDTHTQTIRERVCVCVCVRERERQTDRQTDRQTETDRHTHTQLERKRERADVLIFLCMRKYDCERNSKSVPVKKKCARKKFAF